MNPGTEAYLRSDSGRERHQLFVPSLSETIVLLRFGPILPLGPPKCDFLSGYVQAIGDLKQLVGQSISSM